jgi:hypothetical protein
MSRRLATLIAVVALAAPRTAAACAMCISSAFGDRSYTWPYIGLILAPFIVGVAIAVVLAWYAGWRRQNAMERLSAWTARLRHRPERAVPSTRTTTETT